MAGRLDLVILDPEPSALATPRYRILALDIDGTLLDRDGILRPRTLDAVRRAAKAGIRPVLCTGRRYRKALPIAEQLGLDSPLICNSGAIVKDPTSHRTLRRADLDAEVVSLALAIFRERDEPTVTFTDLTPNDPDFRVVADPSGRPLFDDYLDRNRGFGLVDPGWPDRSGELHYHLCGIGSFEAMSRLEAAILEALAGRVQTFVQKSPRYAGTMCEVLRHDANKWTALLHLADAWGIGPEEICAVGDDRNDVPMLIGAGLGVAMGHSGPDILAVADRVTGSDDEDGVAQLVDELLRNRDYF